MILILQKAKKLAEA